MLDEVQDARYGVLRVRAVFHLLVIARRWAAQLGAVLVIERVLHEQRWLRLGGQGLCDDGCDVLLVAAAAAAANSAPFYRRDLDETTRPTQNE